MRPLGPGALRGLQELADEPGIFSILAIDHRDALRVELDPDQPDSVPAEALTELKLEVLRGVAARASGVMLEPEYSVGPAVARAVLPGSVGFLCAVEAQGYLDQPGEAGNQLLDGWSVEKTKRCGASAAKLLVRYRPDRGAATAAQDHLMATVAAECARLDLALFIEPVPYDVADDTDRRHVVVASAHRAAELGADVVKAPFPAVAETEWADACAELDAALDVPWAVLSWGAPYEVFRRQLEAACAAGASGFMAGRALWRPAVHANDRAATIAAEVVPRFEELKSIAVASARPWTERAAGPDEWDYRSY